MAGTIDRGTLDRLVALGRSRGDLTAGDLRAALPIDDMDVNALVLVMLELDAAGVSVEPEALGPRQDRPGPSAPELPAPPPVAPQGAGTIGDGRAAAVAAPAPPGTAGVRIAPGGATGEDAVGRVVLLSGLVVLLVLGSLLVLV